MTDLPGTAQANPQLRKQSLCISLAVFVGGLSSMAVEMCASRLLAPYFGNSLPVWGLLIGLLLAYLAVGNWVGGRWADRHPRADLLYQLVAWAGILIALVPYLARPILRISVLGFAGYQAGVIIGALLGVLLLFAAPVILLGCISPFAVRLRLVDAASGGNVTGRISALSTVGSLIGTFVPVFWLIPNLGTLRTMLLVSALLLVVASVGLLQTGRRWALLYILLLVLILILQWLPQTPIKPTADMVYEAESAYNYVQVLRNGDELQLKLNEGEGFQSSYRPGQVLTGYVFDYFLLAPFFRSHPTTPVSSLCVIGLAGGTMANQYSEVFGEIPIDGVELDPVVAQIAQRFFGLRSSNVHIIVEDGRYFLTHSTNRYDVLIVDAYRPPYIPFQLATFEFFCQVRDHLTEDGVVAVNVARTEEDFSLVDAIAGTMKAAYPNVYIVQALGDLNSIVIATRQPTQVTSIDARLADLQDPVLRDVAARAQGRIHEFTTPNCGILSDDRAPVEQIVHAMVVRFLLGQNVREEQP